MSLKRTKDDLDFIVCKISSMRKREGAERERDRERERERERDAFLVSPVHVP